MLTSHPSMWLDTGMTTNNNTAGTHRDLIIDNLVETYRDAVAASQRATDFGVSLYWRKIAREYAARIGRYGVDVEEVIL